MPKFDPTLSSSLLARLPRELLAVIEAAPLPGLADQPQSSATSAAIGSWLREAKGAANSVSSTALSGLWLLAGDLDRSHSLSQELHTPLGSWWHGVMHRREGDFENAKYWFRRVGKHSLFSELATAASEAHARWPDVDLDWESLESASDGAFALVDASRNAVRGRRAWVAPLEDLCWVEWQLAMISSL